MNFKTHKTRKPSIGTSFRGQIEVRFDQLVQAFGEPILGSPDDKVAAQWIIEFADGMIATIYNYKTGKNYLGEEGLDPEEIVEWHIGGKSDEAGMRIAEVLNNRVK